ncbi:MobB domain containing protein [Trichuris trichiura]|uniref:MobB domain containing protein n=1 Tax=Trichuris trichiura TaxID=36087 RepID=A0A077ZEH4_TRITR|nr:MobB domain containing protein [Trichuris trichiura]
MDVDKPGKDSYELRKAGAAQTIVASQQRWALMTETPDEEELDLQFLASRMDTSKLDLILVEGFKHEEIAKIVLFRDGAGHRPEELVIDRHVIAVASDVPLNLDVALLDINDLPGSAIGMTTRTPVMRPLRSSRTRSSPPQFSSAHGR